MITREEEQTLEDQGRVIEKKLRNGSKKFVKEKLRSKLVKSTGTDVPPGGSPAE